MPTSLTAGDLKKILTANKATWTIDDRLKDTDPVPNHPLGCDLTKVPKVTDVPRVDVNSLLSTDTANSFLRQVRVNNGLLKASTLQPELVERMATPAAKPRAGVPATGAAGAAAAVAPAPAAAPAGAPGATPSVDWRSRFGWPWLT